MSCAERYDLAIPRIPTYETCHQRLTATLLHRCELEISWIGQTCFFSPVPSICKSFLPRFNPPATIPVPHESGASQLEALQPQLIFLWNVPSLLCKKGPSYEFHRFRHMLTCHPILFQPILSPSISTFQAAYTPPSSSCVSQKTSNQFCLPFERVNCASTQHLGPDSDSAIVVSCHPTWRAAPRTV